MFTETEGHVSSVEQNTHCLDEIQTTTYACGSDLHHIIWKFH